MLINIVFLITAIFLLLDSILALLWFCSELWDWHGLQNILNNVLLLAAGLTLLSISSFLIVVIVCTLC